MIVTGAIRSFEDNHGLTMDGEAGATVWADLMKDVAAGHDNGNGYTYALASKGSPETLTIWHNGKRVAADRGQHRHPAGPDRGRHVPGLRALPFQIMKGTNPDGSKYADPV